MVAVMRAVDALARRFELPPEPVSARPQQARRWRGLTIGNLNLLVEHDLGGELVEDARIHPLPRCSNVCRGLVNLRGQIIPVFNVHAYLEIATPSKRQWLLVLGKEQHALAFAVDALPQALTLTEPAHLQPAALPARLRPFVANAFRTSGALWLEFRHREFFAALSACLTS